MVLKPLLSSADDSLVAMARLGVPTPREACSAGVFCEGLILVGLSLSPIEEVFS
jgi:hypothetical protein